MVLFLTCLEHGIDDLSRVLSSVAGVDVQPEYNDDYNVVVVEFNEETLNVVALKNAVSLQGVAYIISAPNFRFVYTLRELEGRTRDEVKQLVKDDEALNEERSKYFIA
jgi:hypothetical protein